MLAKQVFLLPEYTSTQEPQNSWSEIDVTCFVVNHRSDWWRLTFDPEISS